MPKDIKLPVQSIMTVQFYTKPRYGRQNRYFVDSTMAFAFKQLTGGRVVILDRDMAALSELGFRFEEVKQPNGL